MLHDKTYCQSVGRRIAQLRKEANLTQGNLADALNVSQQNVNSYENGRLRLPLDLLVPLSEALGVSFDAILGTQRGQKKPGPPSKLELQVRQIRELPREKQKWACELLDTVLRTAQRG